MVYRRSAVALSTTALLAGALAACGGGSGSTTGSSGTGQASAGGGSITVALGSAPDTLDPVETQSRIAGSILPNICEKLYDIDANLKVNPMLAAALPTISADGKAYTIKLRSGVKFNDGTPFDAAAVKTSLERAKSDKLSAQAANLAPITGITVVDPTTVKLTLSAPSAPLLSILADRAGMVASPTQLSKLGEKFGTAPVCVGPFAFDSRPSSDTIVLKKSQYYYDASQVKLNKVTFQVVTQPNIRAANLRSGDIQLAADISPTDAASLQGNAGTTVLSAQSLGYQLIVLNVSDSHGAGTPPFTTVSTSLAQHQELRQAFSLALDREQINQAVYAGQEFPSCNMIPANSPLYTKETGCGPDLAKAKQLVAASGVQTPIPVTLIIQASNDLHTKLGTVVQSMEEQAGFKVTLKPEESVTGGNDAKTGHFDAYACSWSGRVDPDQNTSIWWSPTSALNYSGANYQDINKLQAEARVATDHAQRKQQYAQLTQAGITAGNYVVLFHDRLLLGSSKKVTGVNYFSNGVIQLKTASVTG